MGLPVFRRGLELVSSQLNKLSQGIRAAQITSVIGGSFSRTPGGTTIIIDQQTTGGGGGSVALPCPFKATNASTETEQRVEIAQATVATQNPASPYQWPDGMGLDFPPYYLTITSEGYIYCVINFTQPDYNVSTDSTGITFEFSQTLKENTDVNQYVLMATISWDAGTSTIKVITNLCEAPAPNPCSLSYLQP